MIALTELEKKIDDLDIADAANPTMQFRLRGKEEYPGWDEAQRKLIEEASVKYTEYGRLILPTYITKDKRNANETHS